MKQGLIEEREVDAALLRLFTARFRLGMFDPPERVPFSKIPYSDVDSGAHRAIALEAARKSIVLLKNDRGVLPLAASVRTIAVIGPAADDPVALLGNYNGFSRKVVAPLEGIERQFIHSPIRFALGATYTSQTGTPVSARALAPPNGSGHGVLTEYFDNADFSGQPKFSRVDPRLYYDGIGVNPNGGEAGNRGPASLRWTGTLTAPVAGRYQFTVAGCRSSSFVLDGKELAPQPAQGQPGRGFRPAPIDAELEAGHAYQLRVACQLIAAGRSVTVSWIPPAAPLLEQAVDAVKSAEVAVAFVGLNPNLEGEEMPVQIPGFAGGDRTDLNLPESQQKLLEAAVATGKPVVVVLSSGSAVAIHYAAEHAAAILQLWYGGEEVGTAIAETLAGANNPAGRLPVTFYRSAADLPPFDEYSMEGRTYRYFHGDPLYGFGFGLSYAKFAYSGLRSSRDSEARVTISVRVRNESKRDGDEVVQLYVAGSGGDAAIRDLAGFKRIHLRAGETQTVRFTLGRLPTGTKVSVGSGQPVAGVPHAEVTI